MAVQDIAVARATTAKRRYELVEVWGDTVDIRHLRWAIALGIAISFGTFIGASYVLARFIDDPAMTRAYAMLVGLGGCLVAGAVCARLFQPKRIAAEAHADERRRAELIHSLVVDGSHGTVADVRTLPEHVLAEMRQVGLYELFAEQERRARGAAGETDDGLRAAVLADQPKEVLR
ncbi:hypothetical protein [Chitinasiproducens palmae]|uniref:Uncharacterized protein n=1 Tax=Chitinasiproducens palmae TaxID=1770053 RepID=A0A1H2PPR1_9BURK|nr:hypothetical protein [Chitinasiproducens palmae]SDV48737.1 hypothetical protein SAMN05216551_10626 [Chitinasiproducens palmae]